MVQIGLWGLLDEYNSHNSYRIPGEDCRPLFFIWLSPSWEGSQDRSILRYVGSSLQAGPLFLWWFEAQVLAVQNPGAQG